MESRMTVPPKVKHRLTYHPALPLLGVYTKEVKAETWTDICTPRIHSSIVHISQASGTIQVSTHSEWINRMWHIHTKECYSAFKKNRSLPSPVWLGCPVHQKLVGLISSQGTYLSCRLDQGAYGMQPINVSPSLSHSLFLKAMKRMSSGKDKKKNKILIAVVHGWTLKALCQVKWGRHKGAHIIRFPLHPIPETAIFTEAESGIEAARHWGEGEEVSCYAMDTEFQVGGMKPCWRGTVAAPQYEYT